jgi:CheY-like chemotaxis protein
MPKNVLIVEDDDNFYEPIKIQLEQLIKATNADVSVYRAVTRNEALAVMRETEFAVVSTDMGMPMMEGARIEPFAGATLCRSALYHSRYKPWGHLIVLSGQTPENVKKELRENNIPEGTPRYPEIFHKGASREWAQAVLSKCLP